MTGGEAGAILTLPSPWLTALLLPLLLTACAQGTPSPATAPVATSTLPAQVGEPTPTVALAESPVPTDASAPQAGGEWTVAVVQNGQVAPSENDQVRLARAPFTLRVTLPQPLPVKLNASGDDANFIALQPGYVFTEDCFDALCTGMDVAEERLNPTQVLFVDPQSTHYLYYQAPDDHRWSRATVDAGGAVFERDVSLLNDFAIDQFPGSELYLLFFVDSANTGVIDPGELKKITLLFT
jgi:hypothetical protein